MSFTKKTEYYPRVLTSTYLEYNLTPPLIGPLQEPKLIRVYPEGVKITPKKQAAPMGEIHENFQGILSRALSWGSTYSSLVKTNNLHTVQKRESYKCIGENAERWWDCWYCWVNSDSRERHGKACSHCTGWRKLKMDLAWAYLMRQELPYKDNWSWFITWTFRDPAPWAQKLGWSQVGWKYALTAWKAFVVWMQHHLDQYYHTDYRFKYFMVLENQERGVPHIHALFWGEFLRDDERGNIILQLARQYLWERGGYNKIYHYDERLGAELYLSSYLTKEMLYWETTRDSLPELYFRPEWRDGETGTKMRCDYTGETWNYNVWRHSQAEDLPF